MKIYELFDGTGVVYRGKKPVSFVWTVAVDGKVKLVGFTQKGNVAATTARNRLRTLADAPYVCERPQYVPTDADSERMTGVAHKAGYKSWVDMYVRQKAVFDKWVNKHVTIRTDPVKEQQK